MSSTETAVGDRVDFEVTPEWLVRRLALLAAGGLILSYLQVLRRVTIVVGGRPELALVSLAAFVGATACARYVPPNAALGVGVGGFLVGVGSYLLAIPDSIFALATFERVLGDLYVLVTGNLSVMQIVAADVWAIGMAPAPVYLTWYLALRRRYDLAAMAGGLALGFLVLTGDASTVATLGGATALLAMLGLGSIEDIDPDWTQLQDLGLVVLAVVLLTRLVRLVPSNGLTEGPSLSGSGVEPTLEGALVSANDKSSIVGGVTLSPKPRFEVSADRPALWHAGAYDRYTGRNWIQSGGTQGYRRGDLSSPPGPTETVAQEFEALGSTAAVPAAWKPVGFRDAPPVRLRITSEQGLRPEGALTEGQEYAVVSEIPSWTRARLRNAGTDYPGLVTERYLQLPSDLPTRVRQKADDVAGDAETPYDVAVSLSQWLKRKKSYSLEVEKPDGDVVDAFLFGMREGYCVYFATALTVMLRAQGVPARYATGYTPGETVAENTWLVRGYHSHAWVEVYFPGIGWVPFDPTPSGPRQAAQQQRRQRAASRGEGAAGATPTPTPTPTPTETPVPTDENATSTPSQDPGLGVGENPDVQLSPTETPATPTTPTTPTSGPNVVAGRGGPTATPGAGNDLGGPGESAAGRDRLSLLVGGAAVLLGAYRFEVLQRGYEQVRLRWQPSGDSPEEDVVRAFERLELLLSKQYRDRRESETPRMYLQALGEEPVDERARRVGELYERAYYGSDVTDEEAAEAIQLVDRLVGDHGRLP